MAPGALECPKATGSAGSMASFSSIHLRMNWKPAFLPRHFPTETTRPSSMVMMGLIPRRPPTTAVAPEMRPPIFRYLRVSTTASSRTRPASSSTCALSSARESSWSRSWQAASTKRPMPKVTVRASTTAILLSSTMPRAIMADW